MWQICHIFATLGFHEVALLNCFVKHGVQPFGCVMFFFWHDADVFPFGGCKTGMSKQLLYRFELHVNLKESRGVRVPELVKPPKLKKPA